MRTCLSLVTLMAMACGAPDYEPQTRRAPIDTGIIDDTGLFGTDTGPDTDTGTGEEPDPDADPDVDTDPPGLSTDVCYLGAARNNGTCLPTVAPASLPAAYDYPPALSGSAQYREPERYLDLTVVSASTQIAPNFVLSEIASASKGRYGVVQPHAIASLQAVRDAVGALRVNSGYRSPDYNAGVGGASSSRHQYGDGFDLDPITSTLPQLDTSCGNNGAGYTQVYATHVHCDWRNDTVDTMFYGPARRSTQTARLPELHALIRWRGGELTAPTEGWDEGEPLREWSAFSADGTVLESVTAETYLPPLDAVAVDVFVGRRLQRRLWLGAAPE
ncbi:MAG: hypothetical protein ACJAZO_001071 [Myxococcota bacterium]|jgi:hypothetical protein